MIQLNSTLSNTVYNLKIHVDILFVARVNCDWLSLGLFVVAISTVADVTCRLCCILLLIVTMVIFP